MSYIVIEPDGQLHVREDHATGEVIRREVGDWDMVSCRGLPLRGWVSDTGLIDGQTPRNIVGSIMLIACHGPEQPYGGRVVITGWDPYLELQPLDAAHLRRLQEMHSCITKALAGDDTCPSCPAAWKEMVRTSAEFVRTEPVRPIQIVSIDLPGTRRKD